jgi:hypothetical protein
MVADSLRDWKSFGLIFQKIQQEFISFKKIKFPNEMLEIITDNLKKTHDFEQEHYQIKLSDIEGRIKSEE